MRKLIGLLLVFSASFLLFADAVSADSIFSGLTQSKVVSGDFAMEKTAPKLKRPLKSSGKFIFSQEGILWKTLRPFPSSTVVTKDSIIQTLPDGSKSVTDGSSNEVFKSVSQTVSSVFSGDRSVLEEYFSISDFSASTNSWSMSLRPKDSTIGSVIKQIEIGGSLGGQETDVSLDSIRIVQGESESTLYALSNKEYRQELSDEEKAFFR